MQTHKEIQEVIVLEQKNKVWIPDRIFIDYVEADAWLKAQRHRFPTNEEGRQWRLRPVPAWTA